MEKRTEVTLEVTANEKAAAEQPTPHQSHPPHSSSPHRHSQTTSDRRQPPPLSPSLSSCPCPAPSLCPSRLRCLMSIRPLIRWRRSCRC